jgi:hypothetical protein
MVEKNAKQSPKTNNPDTDPMRKPSSVPMSKPIPPKSVVRLVASPKPSPRWKKNVGAIFRVGYYSRKDGLDCVWLVNESGEYQETVDHDYLSKYFDVIQISDEKNLYGMRKPPIGPVKRAWKRRS